MSEQAKQSKSNSFIYALKSVRKHTNPLQKKKIAGLSVLIFMSAVFDVVGLAAVLPLIKAGTDINIIHSNKYLDAIYTFMGFETEKAFVLFLIGVILSYFVFKTVFGIFVSWLTARLAADIAVFVTRNQFTKYYQLDFLDFNSIKSSLVIRNVFYNPTSYVQWIINPLMMILSEVFIVILIIGAIASYNLFLFGFIMLTIGPATYMVYRALKKKGANIGNGIDQVFPYALSTLTEAINGYIDIKISGTQSRYQSRYLRHQKNYQELQQSANLLSQIPLRTNEVIALLGIVMIFLYAMFIAKNNADVIIMVGAFAAAAYRLMPSMSRLLNSFMYVNKNQKTIENLDMYEDLLHNPVSAEEEKPVSFKKSIEFRNVSFRFPKTEKPVLQHLNFEIRKGEKIGFIGLSGSGKTTIMNLLLRFYKEEEGAILVDGVPLVDEHITSWRSHIGYVKQDIFLLDGSIKENITLGEPEVNEELLKKVITQASLHQLVESLPEGIDSPIGEKGATLSGGQRQRIGIARSLYRNAEILIFDEATSALDTVTENEVTESIDALSEVNKTIFIIAHRITTLRNCDRIYELKNGTVAGIHNYRDLVAKVLS
jgi:ATP-binding cassette, subfamily B, bacterial PglK